MSSYYHSPADNPESIGGPYYPTHLLDLWQSGSITAPDRLCEDGTEYWEPAATVMDKLRTTATADSQVMLLEKPKAPAQRRGHRIHRRAHRGLYGLLVALLFGSLGGVLIFIDNEIATIIGSIIGGCGIIAGFVIEKRITLCSACGNTVSKTATLCGTCGAQLTRKR